MIIIKEIGYARFALFDKDTKSFLCHENGNPFTRDTFSSASGLAKAISDRNRKVLLQNEADYYFNKWKYYIGFESSYYKIELTEEKLKEWSEQDYKEVICIFCDNIFPVESWYCTRCREYKGIVPAIEGWSV